MRPSMEREQHQPQPQRPSGEEPDTDEEVPTARETGRSPRPSQAEGDRETIEEDLGDRS